MQSGAEMTKKKRVDSQWEVVEQASPVQHRFLHLPRIGWRGGRVGAASLFCQKGKHRVREGDPLHFT